MSKHCMQTQNKSTNTTLDDNISLLGHSKHLYEANKKRESSLEPDEITYQIIKNGQPKITKYNHQFI